SRDGSLRALLWPQGEVAWQRLEADVVGVAPVGEDLVVAEGAALVRLRANDGSEVWRTPISATSATAPTAHGGYAFVASRDGWLHSIRLSDGGHTFKVEVGQLVAPPSAASGVLLIPVRGGEVHAFDINKREVMWSYDLE